MTTITLDAEKMVLDFIGEFIYFEIDDCIEGEDKCAAAICCVAHAVDGRKHSRDDYDAIKSALVNGLSNSEDGIVGLEETTAKIIGIIKKDGEK